LSGLIASGNTYNGIAINGTTIPSNRTWDGGGLGSYLIADDVTIAPGATLTIAPGLTIYLDNPNTDLVVQGTLKAQGTVAAPIHFRSGNAFTPGNIAPMIGDWGSIMFRPGSSNSLLEYAIVEEGGGIDAGIAIESSSVIIRNNTITRNTNGGIRVIEGAPTITRNNFIGNTAFGEYGVRNTGTARVTATCNWWEAASGPTHVSNPSGTGQGVTDDVVFAPWLVAQAPGGACTGTNVHLIYLPLLRR
jgi:parallel beta-helix repeat protein